MDAQTEAQLIEEVHALREQLADKELQCQAMDATERQRDESEARLRTFLAYSPEAIVLLDVETGRFLDVNPQAESLFQLSRRDLLQVGPFSLSPAFQPAGSSTALGQAHIDRAMAGEEQVFEWWHRNARRERIPCEVRLVKMPWGEREVLRGSILDITDRKLLELSELGRRQILDSVARRDVTEATLTNLVVTLERLLPGVFGMVSLLDSDASSLTFGAAPSLPAAFSRAFDGIPIGPEVASCGAAAFTGRTVVAADVMGHPNWSGFRMLAREAGIGACWSEPVLSVSGEILGIFSLHHRESGRPAPVELRAGQIGAQLAAAVIAHGHSLRDQRASKEALERSVASTAHALTLAKQKLGAAEEDARLAAVAFDTHDTIVITDAAGKILRVNRSFTEVTGYLPEEVVGKTNRILKSGQHSEEFYREMWGSLRARGCWEGEIWNRRKDGRLYLQRLTIAAVKDPEGRTTHYVGDGQDVTEAKQAASDRAAIEAAREVQRRLFPGHPPDVNGCDLSGKAIPAERVSGDFYDFLDFGADSCGVVVADVTGHGLAPALLMAETQAYLRAFAERECDPGKLLTHTNRLFARHDPGRFVTCFLGRLDLNTYKFSYAAAGHQAYLIRTDGEAVSLSASSLPLGIDENATLTTCSEIDIFTGDILLLPTDGIEEAQAPDGKIFGRGRIFEIIRLHRHRSAEEIVSAILREAREFGEGELLYDDMTAVIVKID